MERQVLVQDGNEPIISVIVPVYNVEAYLDRCINSILAQTFLNFELLLVNDGSTDGSGDICKRASRKDVRTKVYCKTNGGLSDARNYGMERAAGKFITFVDSDDWIDPNYLTYLYNGIEQTGAEISTCIYNVQRAKTSTPWKLLDDAQVEFSSREALLSLFYDERITVSATGKLFNKTLFDSIRFPVSMHFEDVGTTYRLLLAANSIVVGGAPLYYYYMRPGSIVHLSGAKIFDRYELALEAYNELCHVDKELSLASERYLVFHTLSVLRMVNLKDASHYNHSKMLRAVALKHRRSVLTNSRAPFRDKVALVALSFGPRFLQFAWAIYATKTGRNS